MNSDTALEHDNMPACMLGYRSPPKAREGAYFNELHRSWLANMIKTFYIPSFIRTV